MLRAEEALGVGLVDVLRSRTGAPRTSRSRRSPSRRRSARRCRAPRSARRGSARRRAAQRPPARPTASRAPPSRAARPPRPLAGRPARRSAPPARGRPRPGSAPPRAVISAASRRRISPSLSVVQAEPSRRRNEAPARSSPPNPSVPSSRPSTNHLKPTGTSTRRRPRSAATRSMMLLLTSVLPTDSSAQSRLPPNR